MFHSDHARKIRAETGVVVRIVPAQFNGDNSILVLGLGVADLAEKECIPCKGGVPPLQGEALARLTEQVGKEWRVVNGHHLERDFKFENFRQALDFTNRIGELAEAQNHHPDIYLAWGKVKLTLWTHKIDGLTESDFVFAAKVNRLAA